MDESQGSRTDVSSADLERRYAVTGQEVSGPCEMRQAWKYNDLTPRTYFAQGGTAYHASKYIRSVMNSLVDRFPETNFLTRFSLQDVKMSNQHTAFIYDYSSFSSNFTEYKYFLSALSDAMDQVPIRIVDSREGIINWTLGALIREYNEVCNRRGQFSILRYHAEHLLPIEHTKAGFLGVYGNIAGCTTLHGLHAANAVGDAGSSRCVGDDVFGSTPIEEPGDKDNLICAIQSLGEVNEAKFNWWTFQDIEDEGDEDHSWPYTKRPLDRLQNRMVLEQALYLPIFGLIVPLADGIHDFPLDVQDRVKILAQQTLSVIGQVKQLYPPPDEAHQVILRNFLRSLYRSVGCPIEGRLPFESFYVAKKQVSGLLLPCLEEDFLYEDPWSLLENRFVNRSEVLVQIPRSLPEPTYEFDKILKEMGNPVQSCLDQRLRYCRMMDWMECVPLVEVRFMDFEEYRRFYTLLLDGDLYRLYDVRVLEGAPVWLPDLLLA